MLQKIKTVSQTDLGGGLNTTPNIYNLQPNQTPRCVDIRFGIDRGGPFT